MRKPHRRLRRLSALLPLVSLGLAMAPASVVTAAREVAAGAALADVPLPKPRPSPAGAAPVQPVKYPTVESGPSDCDKRLAGLADFVPVPVLVGPGGCGARDVVRLEAVIMPDQRRVTLDQPATLRCTMAEAVTHWVRDDVRPAAEALGSPLTALAAYESYECRGRNRVAGARISEHGKANAIDIIGVRLADGRNVVWTDTAASRDFRERIKASACARFMTVLGPGSDGHHEDHIHVDLAERASGYRICQWNVIDASAVAAAPAGPIADPVPLPRQRPAR